MLKSTMDKIVEFSEFLVQTVKDEESRGNTKAREIIIDYREVILDGIHQYENDISSQFEALCSGDCEDLKKLKKAHWILR